MLVQVAFVRNIRNVERFNGMNILGKSFDRLEMKDTVTGVAVDKVRGLQKIRRSLFRMNRVGTRNDS